MPRKAIEISKFVCVLVVVFSTGRNNYAFHPDDPTSEDNIPPHDFKSRGGRSEFLLDS